MGIQNRIMIPPGSGDVEELWRGRHRGAEKRLEHRGEAEMIRNDGCDKRAEQTLQPWIIRRDQHVTLRTKCERPVVYNTIDWQKGRELSLGTTKTRNTTRQNKIMKKQQFNAESITTVKMRVLKIHDLKHFRGAHLEKRVQNVTTEVWRVHQFQSS